MMSKLFEEERKRVMDLHQFGWNYLSTSQQAAYIAKSIMQRLVLMDDDTPAERIRELMEESYFAMRDWEDSE